MALLRGISGDVEGQDLELVENETTIGRHDNNKIVLPHLSVSSFHCVILKSGDKFTIKDIDSTNGTRVDGQKIKVRLLAHGNKVMIGGLAFRFLTDPDTPVEGQSSGPESPGEINAAAKVRRNEAAQKIRAGVSTSGKFKKTSKFRGKSLLVFVAIAVVLGLAGLIALFVSLSRL